MSHRLLKTDLSDRTLWYDGQSSYSLEQLYPAIQKGYNVKWVNKLSSDITQYNKIASDHQQLQIKDGCDPLLLEWNLPNEYKTLNVFEYVFEKHIQLTEHMLPSEVEQRDIRLIEELHMYASQQLLNILRTIIYIINTLTANKVVWGIGRGSSVSSYVLYVIGVHDVDSFKYNLDISDFFHK